MRILFLTNHLNYGGISAYLFSLGQALRRKGVDVFVASRGGDMEPLFEQAGLVHWRVPLTTKCETSLKVFYSVARLAPQVKKYKIDLLHAQTRVTQVLAAMLSRLTGVPYLSTCHGYFKRRILRRWMPCWGARVVAISDQVREHLLRDFGVPREKIALVYNGIDLEKYAPRDDAVIRQAKKDFGLDPSKKIIGHLGRLSVVKGQKYLILAAQELLFQNKNLQFLLIGDGKDEVMLKEMVRQRGLEKDVIFYPSVKDISLALSVMDVFVFPSLSEGLGLALVEAQAQGVPVAASRVGGVESVVQDGQNGLLFEAGDVPGIVAAVGRLLRDSDLRHRLVSAGRENADKKFSLSTMVESMTRVYQDALSAR